MPTIEEHERVVQEVYCNDCDGFLAFHVSKAIKCKKVEVVCPNCGRKHPRTIENGQIKDNFRGHGTPEEIILMSSAYSKKPRTGIKVNARNGYIVESWDDIQLEQRTNAGWFDGIKDTIMPGKSQKKGKKKK